MTDPTITIGLAGLALTATIGLQALRATHFDGKLEKLHDSISEWLQTIENELKSELKTLIAQGNADPPIIKIVEIASNFSSVKEKQTRVEELHSSNSQSIRESVIVILGIIGAALGSLFAIGILAIEVLIAVGISVWLLSIYNTYQFIGEYNHLNENVRKRRL